MITVNHVSKTYLQGETQIHALSDVSLQIDPGETVAIIGTSGSGKSTLMSLMAGLDSPESGSIHFNETNITQLSEKELSQFRAENIGIVFQQFHLMPHLTAMENVMLPMELTGKS
ncbi:MAG: ABC transporter ATP-binding protein, partial [Bdellovibrionaceae bacterium]|nr:ABC transporter ATP-binding protein [Pseudobdellovibrionaceae bacterium]